MDLTLRDLYYSVLDTKKAFWDMDVDIDNALCGTPKCILTEAQTKLLANYQNLLDSEIDFCTLDLDKIITQIHTCFDCIDITDVAPVIAPPSNPAAETYNNCVGTQTLTLDDIRRFRVYEYSRGSIDVYIVPKANLPYSFTTGDVTRTYSMSWDSTLNCVRITYRNTNNTDPAPVGGASFASVVAELETATATALGITEKAACRGFVFTSGVNWQGGFGLAVDGNDTTYPALLNNNLKSVEVGFQFSV
jgi:hypothetical protein